MSSSKSTSSADSWGLPVAASTRRVAKPAGNVPDDWDADGDEVEEVEDPQKLWEEANQRTPMPQLVIAGSNTTGSSVTSPPPAAFQPVLRILKRPTATPSSSSSSSTSFIPSPGSGSSNTSSGTYAQREARYQAARDRIFGDGSGSTPGTPNEPSRSETPNSVPKPSPPPVQIARQPKGPPVAQSGTTEPNGGEKDDDSRGFGSRRGKRRGGGKP